MYLTESQFEHNANSHLLIYISIDHYLFDYCFAFGPGKKLHTIKGIHPIRNMPRYSYQSIWKEGVNTEFCVDNPAVVWAKMPLLFIPRTRLEMRRRQREQAHNYTDNRLSTH